MYVYIPNYVYVYVAVESTRSVKAGSWDSIHVVEVEDLGTYTLTIHPLLYTPSHIIYTRLIVSQPD